MATIEQLVCTWNGFQGAPGYSVFYGSQGGGAQPTFLTFFNALKPYLPATVNVTIPNTGRQLDEATGKQTGVWTNGTLSVVQMQATGNYAPQAGALVRWYTNVYDNGRRIRGRTYLVPTASSAYTTTGVMLTAAQTVIAQAADTLWRSNGTSLKVWHRPIYEGKGNDAVLKRAGAAYPIVLSDCSPKIATLMRRRDV